MRDYGSVHTCFWANPDIQELSSEAKLLALYLLTGPHTNMLGCFRLPVGYVAEDLKWSAETVSKRFAELFQKGFVTRDEATGWVLIPRFLEWNPIDNPNQAKSLCKLFNQIPEKSFIYKDLIEVLLTHSKYFEEPFRNRLETLSKGFSNRFETRIRNRIRISIRIQKKNKQKKKIRQKKIQPKKSQQKKIHRLKNRFWKFFSFGKKHCSILTHNWTPVAGSVSSKHSSWVTTLRSCAKQLLDVRSHLTILVTTKEVSATMVCTSFSKTPTTSSALFATVTTHQLRQNLFHHQLKLRGSNMTTSTTNNIPKPLSKIFSGSNSMNEQKNASETKLFCEQHGEYEGRMFSVANKMVKSLCPACVQEKHQCKKELDQKILLQRKQQKIQSLANYAGIPERFKNHGFDNFNIQHEGEKRAHRIALAYAEQFEERLAAGGGLLLTGYPGTGKTHLAVAIANHVMRTGRSVLFTTAMRALRSVKDSYHRDAVKTEQAAINLFCVPDLLILDEVGVQFGTQAEQLILFEILNGRYEAVLPTIVISNVCEEDLKIYMGERVIDRLREGGGASISFEWNSYRKQAHLNPKLPKRQITEVNWEI